MFEQYPDIVKVSEVQQMIRRGKKTVYALLRNKEIKADRRGSDYIIPKLSVIRYVESISCSE